MAGRQNSLPIWRLNAPPRIGEPGSDVRAACDTLDPAPFHFGDRGLILCASIRLDDRLPAPYPSEKPSSRTFALD